MKRLIRCSTTAERISYLEDKIAILEDFLDNGKYGDEEEMIDAQMELEELREQLNFAYQDDEAEYNYAREQQEFNPDGSLKYYN